MVGGGWFGLWGQLESAESRPRTRVLWGRGALKNTWKTDTNPVGVASQKHQHVPGSVSLGSPPATPWYERCWFQYNLCFLIYEVGNILLQLWWENSPKCLRKTFIPLKLARQKLCGRRRSWENCPKSDEVSADLWRLSVMQNPGTGFSSPVVRKYVRFWRSYPWKKLGIILLWRWGWMEGWGVRQQGLSLKATINVFSWRILWFAEQERKHYDHWVWVLLI